MHNKLLILSIAVIVVAVALTNYSDLASFFVTNISAQNISDTIESTNLSLSGRISSMLMPIASSAMDNKSSLSSLSSAMMTDSDMMMMQEDTAEKAMKFSMAQDVTWLLSGDWNLVTNSNSNNMTTFDAAFTKLTTNGTMKHSHKINNFTSSSSTSNIPTDMNKFSGKADVYFNDDLAWKQAKMNLTLLSDEVLKIDIDSTDIDNHFHGDPIYGVVTKKT